MNATLDRLASERQFHDAQSAERAASFRRGVASLRFDDDTYLNHESWIRPAFDRLGDVRGKRVLDLGCGHGMMATLLARHGAHVMALDLSEGYIRETQLRARANGVAVHTTIGDAESLPFESEAFDAVWGNAILHHLHLPAAVKELRRVLKPGGVAVFCEPWGGNPLLRLARRRLPYPGKHRTPDERPLDATDLPALRSHFPHLSLQGFQLFGMLRRLSSRLSFLDGIDRPLLKAFPPLKNFCRYMVLTLPAD